jgi:hypothetical protein
MQPIQSENNSNFQEDKLYENSYNCVICGLNHYFHEPNPHEYFEKSNKKRQRDNSNFDDPQIKKHKTE